MPTGIGIEAGVFVAVTQYNYKTKIMVSPQIGSCLECETT
jgi:hypothetical protein